jgi:hypothetical protein
MPLSRSLLPEYRHDIILKSFAILNQKELISYLQYIGDGTQL